MKQFKYTTCFSSTVKCLINKERDKFLSQASLDDLKAIIPDYVKTQEDLLCIAANAFVSNMGNLNGDMVSTDSTLDFYQNFIHKGINLEHDRKSYCGHIVSASLSQFDSKYSTGVGSKIIEASDVKGKLFPFNVSLAGVLYKTYSEDLTDLIEASNDPDSNSYLNYGASWELGFLTYSLAIGSKYLEDCEIIKDESKISELSKYLLSSGGSGKLPDGRPIYRLVDGEIFPLGIALTSRPAAAVLGIVTANKNEDKSKLIDDIDASKVKNVINIQNNQNSLSHLESDNVKGIVNKTNYMILKSLKDINDEVLKECKAADITNLYDAEVKKISDEWEKKNKEGEIAVKAASTKAEDLAKEVKDTADKFTKLQEQFTKINDEHSKLVKANQDREKLDAFSARMETLENEYELSQEEKDILAEDIKTIENDEAFAKFMKKNNVFLKNKKKSAKNQDDGDPEDKKDKGADEDTEDKNGNKKSAKGSAEDESKKTLEDAIKNGEKDKAKLANASDGGEKTLTEKYAAAFGQEGWEVESKRKNRN